MADDTLNVRFGVISHGWLPITFCVSDEDTVFNASDVPADPISWLVSLSRFLISADLGSRDIEFHLEPEYCVLTATKSNDPTTASFRLVQPGCKLSVTGLSSLATATQIWRALSSIQSDVQSAFNHEQWSWEFPSRQMDLLSSEIETARAQ